MFKHRFNPEAAHDFRSVIDAVDIMIGRAKSTLNMMTTYLEGDCDDLHNHDVAGVVYGVLAELEDVGEVLNAHFKSNNNLSKQVEALSYIILHEKLLTPDKLKLILDFSVLPESEKEKNIELIRQQQEVEIETMPTIH